MTLRVSKVSKKQENRWVFRDVEFDVATGEIFGIFGPKGTEKRLFLDLIAGAVKPNGGSIAINDSAPTDANIGFFRNDRSGSFFFRLLGKQVPDSRIELSEFEDFFRNTPASVLLLDDPFDHLESPDREKLGATLREAAETGKSVIFTSSSFDDMLEYADRCSVLAAGYVEQTAAPQEVYDEPSSVAVAAMVGRNNLIAARRLTSSKSESPEYITLSGEHRLFTRRTAKASLGALNQNITLMIRPEQISISFGASFPEDNLLKATVSAVRPMGATTRVELDCEGLHLEALVLRLVGLDIGEECMVGLPPDRIIVLRA